MNKKTESAAKPRIRLRYESTEVRYGAQFVVNATKEDIVVNCSSGAISDPATGENLLPIHTRLMLTPASAQRLVDTLQQAIRGTQSGVENAAAESGLQAEASLPKIN